MIDQTLTTPDGARLALRVFEPLSAERGSVVIAAAMAVPQSFYSAFAQWLAAQGWRVLSFDYRGTGASGPGEGAALKGVRVDLLDWVDDLATVVLAARAARPARPLYLVGHSLGAQLPGLLGLRGHDPAWIDGLVGVAAGTGYWGHMAPRLKRKRHLFWHGIIPVSTALCGYFPGRRLGILGDVPKGAILHWRRWCLHPDYAKGAEGGPARDSYDAVQFPIWSLMPTDDEMMAASANAHLLSLYTHAPKALQAVNPRELNVPRVGHLGAFRKEQAQGLWPIIHAGLCNGLQAARAADQEAR